jgi:hypothetical protein
MQHSISHRDDNKKYNTSEQIIQPCPGRIDP